MSHFRYESRRCEERARERRGNLDLPNTDRVDEIATPCRSRARDDGRDCGRNTGHADDYDYEHEHVGTHTSVTGN